MKCFLFQHISAVLLIVAMTICIGIVGLKCFQCSSIVGSHGCYAHDLREEYLRECASRQGARPMCRTLLQVQYFKPEQELVLVRECAYVHSNTTQCETSKFSTMHYSQVCECDTDGCNRAVRLRWRSQDLLMCMCMILVLVIK